jgi:hypothetical protein
MSEPESIYSLFDKVKEHPDFVFGTIFTKDDLPGSMVPSSNMKKRATEAMVVIGFEFLKDIA